MNNDRNRIGSYGSYDRQYQQDDNNGRQYRQNGDWDRQPQYRQDRSDWRDDREDDNTRRQSPESRRYEQSRQQAMRGQDGYRDDYYNIMYDTSNYYAEPRGVDYGLPYGAENDLDKTDHYARPDWAYSNRRTPYRYSMGYNPNYDNPEEGDLYRDFDSRGNHGFRHDMAYGNEDEFREFGNDRFGRSDRTDNSYYGHFGGYNR